MRKFVCIHLALFLIIGIFSNDPWPFLLLTVAQILYVPIALKMVMRRTEWLSKNYYVYAAPAYLSIVMLQTTDLFPILFASVYLAFTVCIALLGLSRFLKRGFTNMEEFAIDLAMMYIALGGAWYFAYAVDIDTGFTPLLTWLTAIHFHYSAFLLPIFIGFLGRLSKPRSYTFFSGLLLIAPMVVAIGITFSRWIELFSVLLYIVGLAGIIVTAWRSIFANRLQKWLVVISFTSLAVTIAFSLLYVLGNGFGLTSITIDFMLRFHGLLNCVIFALFGILGWSLAVPEPRFRLPTFPISQIRGKQSITGLGKAGQHRGLVDEMGLYNIVKVSSAVSDFYENTIDYCLHASIHWHRWFLPFAFIYSLFSRKTEQINLPLHAREVEMTGDILSLDRHDGRENTRAWVRKIGDRLTFLALYSHHQNELGRNFMNIALPLPFSTMTGVLELNQVGEDLQLTSRKSDADSDAGTYLSFRWGPYFKLPIEENFLVREEANSTLSAKHTMRIFSLPFLTIDYTITKK